MIHMDNTMNWYERTTNESQRRIASLINVSHTTLSRASLSPSPSPVIVRDVARACGVDPLAALYHAGFLTADEIATRRGSTALTKASTRELLQELLRREVNSHDQTPNVKS